MQVDGGSKNANKTLLAMLELLVSKRAIRRIHFTRLPTGHTHEDIDAVFAEIWSWFRDEIINTPSEFKRKLEEKFKTYSSTHLKNMVVQDVFVVPDYKVFLADYILPIERLHTEMNTKHQWRFECVPISTYFPLGWTTYRAYANDRVIEIIELCVTDIERLTGLDPVMTDVRWEPNADADPNRPGIEGMYLLKEIPVLKDNFQPAPFEEGFEETLNKLWTAISNKLHTSDSLDEDCRKEWFQWISSATTMPGLEGAQQHIQYHKFPTPLLHFLTNPNRYKNRWDLTPPLKSDRSAPSLIWPSSVAYAMPSVVTTFTPHPPPPRIFDVSVEQLTMTERMKESWSTYYDRVAAMTNDTLKGLLR